MIIYIDVRRNRRSNKMNVNAITVRKTYVKITLKSHIKPAKLAAM